MIDTESGKPKARARTIRRWVTFIVVLVILAIAYALGWIPHPGAHAFVTGVVSERLILQDLWLF
jgi:hypothetical protein